MYTYVCIYISTYILSLCDADTHALKSVYKSDCREETKECMRKTKQKAELKRKNQIVSR